MENTNYLNSRIEALENELRRVNSMNSKLTKNAFRINTELKEEKIIVKYKEGKFISSQKVVSELRKDVEYYKNEMEVIKDKLEAIKDRAQLRLDTDREKIRLAREDAKYWANEAAKFEINCNNCNFS